MTITSSDVPGILDLHRKWCRGENGGRRADLQGAYLQDADLRRADLRRAYLQDAYLQGADLRGALHAFASVSFLGHGECGRTLTAMRRKEGDPPELMCGCFSGNTKALREYITNGPERYRKTRTLALDTVLALLDARNDDGLAQVPAAVGEAMVTP